MIVLNLSDAAIQSFSRNELNILKFVIEHQEELLSMSIQELSRQVNYSTSTILRFCRKLGYSGFAELKYVIRTGLKEKPGEEMKGENKKETTGLSREFSQELYLGRMSSNIEGTSKLLSEDLLMQAFQIFDSDRPIYIWSPGGMTSVCSEYLDKLLISIGRQKTYLIETSRVMNHILQTASSDAVLVLISTSGMYEPTIRLGRLAAMNGIPIISISPYTNNELAGMSTVSFRFFAPPRENKGADLTTRLPVFYTINMIIQCYLRYCRAKEKSEEDKV